MASINSRKRLTPATTDDGVSITGSVHRSKRMRLDEAVVPSSSISPRTRLNTPVPFATPPASAVALTRVPTISLKLQVPEKVSDEKEKRIFASRKIAATRWAKEGKLQRPMPDNKEIKAAYNLKLMRHYPVAPAATPNPLASDPSTSAVTLTAFVEDNFIRPVIQKSERVTNLLKSFPKLDASDDAPTKWNVQAHHEAKVCEQNKQTLQSEEVRRLAWRSFSIEDPLYQRQCMIESALPTDDLGKESRGIANNLPDWVKHRTSKFAREEHVKTNEKKRRKKQA